MTVDCTFSSLDRGIHCFSFTSTATGLEVITVNDLANPAMTSCTTVTVGAAGGGSRGQH